MAHPIVAFAAEALGFPLFPGQAEILDEIYTDGIREGVLRCGRRSGKGRLASVMASYESTANSAVHLAAVPAGEQVAVVVIAKTQPQARIIHRYIAGYLRRPALGVRIVRDTVDELELSNGMVIMTLPCHAASVRGHAIAVIIADEAAHWTGVDGSPLDPAEIWHAVSPGVAQFPEHRKLVLSTPRFASGWFAELCERADSGAFPDMRHWHRTTAEMNPRISAAFLDRERATDPVYFSREYLAEWGEGEGAVFEPALIRAAIRDEADLPPRPGQPYVLATDAAVVGDRFAAIVGHRDRDGRVIVDRLRQWKGTRANPVQIDATLDELADMARAYNRATILIDQFAAEPIRQGFAARGLYAEQRPWTNQSKIDAVGAVRRALYAKNLSIPRHVELVAELSALEQRPTASGRPRIAAPGRQHDDWASCLMMLCLELGDRSGVATSHSGIPSQRPPVIHRGGLTLVGRKYIDVDQVRRIGP